MKKYFNYALVLFAGLSVVLSCSKIEKEVDNPVVEPGTEVDNPSGPVSIPVTVTATLSDALTKVQFEAKFEDGTDAFKPTGMSRTWENTDKLRVYDSAHSQYVDLDLESGDGTNTAVFHGTLDFTSATYDVEVFDGKSVADYNNQNQACDGDTGHLTFVASATGVTDLTAAINLSETSGVLGLIAQMPAAATDIESVEIVNMSTNASVVKINLTDPAVGTDHVLKLFANVSAGWTWAAGEYFIRFNAPPTAAHKVYTRYYKLDSGVVFGTQASGVGEYRPIKLNCSHTDQYAGKDDDGTAAHPYLIADGYQLAAINTYAKQDGSTTYIKMIDDIDMSGITHNAINNGVSGYTIIVDFDGNSKTISKLEKVLFYVFKGSIKNLTLDQCTRTTDRAIFSDYVQGTGHSITNVDITNSSYSRGAEKVGALLGIVNSGTTDVTSVTISNCDIENTNVTASSNKGNVGTLIGYVDAKIIVEYCTAKKTGSGDNKAVTGAAANVGGLFGIFTAKANGSSIDHCDVSCVDVTGESKTYVGGIAGRIQAAVTISNCSYTEGTVTGANYTGGLVASLEGGASSEISKCRTSGTVAGSSSTGGILGAITGGTVSKSITSCTISGASNVGGFAGNVTGGTISDCAFTGASVTATGNTCGGFAGQVSGTGISISSCFATGTVTGPRRLGGLISNLYQADITLQNCAAWNSTITPGNYDDKSWSSGAIVGTIHPNCHASNNFRNPDMSLTAWCVPDADFDQPDIDGTTTPLYWNSQEKPFTWSTCDQTAISAGDSNIYAARWAYHGKHVAPGTTLSQLASTTLGWDSSIWDFSGELPTLK